MVRDDRKHIYQDSVTITTPLNREHDDNAGGDVDWSEKDIAAAEALLGGALTG